MYSSHPVLRCEGESISHDVSLIHYIRITEICVKSSNVLSKPMLPQCSVHPWIRTEVQFVPKCGTLSLTYDLKMPPAKLSSFCLGSDVLNILYSRVISYISYYRCDKNWGEGGYIVIHPFFIQNRIAFHKWLFIENRNCSYPTRLFWWYPIDAKCQFARWQCPCAYFDHYSNSFDNRCLKYVLRQLGHLSSCTCRFLSLHLNQHYHLLLNVT